MPQQGQHAQVVEWKGCMPGILFTWWLQLQMFPCAAQCWEESAVAAGANLVKCGSDGAVQATGPEGLAAASLELFQTEELVSALAVLRCRSQICLGSCELFRPQDLAHLRQGRPSAAFSSGD